MHNQAINAAAAAAAAAAANANANIMNGNGNGNGNTQGGNSSTNYAFVESSAWNEDKYINMKFESKAT